MSETFYRIQPASRPVTELLDEANWQSRVWDGDRTKPCTDCYLGETADGETCPTCRGYGDVEDIRRGVSACWSLERLISYFQGRGAHLSDCVVVEFVGDYADEDDLDEADGASLTHPRRIISVTPLAAEIAAVLNGADDLVEVA